MAYEDALKNISLMGVSPDGEGMDDNSIHPNEEEPMDEDDMMMLHFIGLLNDYLMRRRTYYLKQKGLI